MNLFGVEITLAKNGKNGDGHESKYVRITRCMEVHVVLDKRLDEKFQGLKDHVDTKIQSVTMRIEDLKDYLKPK